MSTEYEAVIGLEIHVQLSTKTKAFSSEMAEYGGMPNTQISAISLGHPGTLPMHNSKAIELAAKMGLALNCSITRENHYSRKNYFYADLPKGYQITQFNTPICTGGFVKIKPKGETSMNVRLIRIHMEEDTGKSMHDQDMYDSLLDFNRAGTPLIEVVTEPDIKNGEQAYAFVTEIRKLVRYLDICDGNMEEGSLRCDANVSVRPVGQKEFGTKVEVKNMNSISNVKRAIDFEIQRQTQLLKNGEKVMGETRGFNALQGTTFSMRKKEMINDYRYFPEPDLPPFFVSDEYLNRILKEMPKLPEVLFHQFTEEMGLSEYDAAVLTDDKMLAQYYLDIIAHTKQYKTACNWLSVNIKGYCNENAIEIQQFPVSPKNIAELIELIHAGTINNTIANQKLFPAMIQEPNETAKKLMEKLGLEQNSDSAEIGNAVNSVIEKFPEKVAEYQNGKTGLLGLFVGEVMKLGKGKFDPKLVNSTVKSKLDEK